MSHGRIRNRLHVSREWMSETLMPTVARASVLPDGNRRARKLWRPRDPPEGRGEQVNVSDGGNMTILRDRATMSTKHKERTFSRSPRPQLELT